MKAAIIFLILLTLGPAAAEELLALLPKAPDGTAFTPGKLQERWSDIQQTTIGDTPAKLYDDIIAAFRKRKIDLPVDEGDPRAIRFTPPKVIVK